MSQENVEVVRQVMNAFNERDLQTLLPHMDPMVEFYAPETAAAVGRKTLYRGHEGVRQFMQDTATVWRRQQVFAHDFRFTSNCVVVIGRAIGERHSGEAMDRPAAWAWKLRDRKVLWGRPYEKLADALADVGIPQTEEDVRAES